MVIYQGIFYNIGPWTIKHFTTVIIPNRVKLECLSPSTHI
jgi:hypothetical protein